MFIICDFGVVLELVGGFLVFVLVFILLVFVYFVMFFGFWFFRRRLLVFLVVGFGMIVLVLSCGLSFKKVWSGEGGKLEC